MTTANVPKRPAPPKRAVPPKSNAKKSKAPRVAPPSPERGDLDLTQVTSAQGQLPEVYYDEQSTMFFMRVPCGEFVRMTEGGIKMELRLSGLANDPVDGQPSEVDEEVARLKRESFVRWAGPLAGHWAGRVVINGNAILVINSPTIIEPNPDFQDDTVHAYFERLLGEEQALYFHVWIKLARQALLSKSLRRGPALILVGKADHGKSLGGHLIGRMLGGREADPTQFAQGETTFNAHLFGNELLLADDKGGGHDDYHARMRTASVIKQLVANKTPECHGKNRTPIGLEVFWRVMFALNDEPEDLLVLPSLSDGIMDKLIIFKTQARAVTAKTDTDEQYKAYEKKLYGAIPDYLGWLDQWEIPAELTAGRFGMSVYHNPDVLADLQLFAPEAKLLQLIDECGKELWNQKLEAHDIEVIVKAYNEREARDLLRRPGSCGKLLTRLVSQQPNRVSDVGRYHGGSRRYMVLPPENCTETASE